MTRPDVLVAVVGTGTEVGKTWVSARLLEHWRAGGRRVAARKPAQSSEPGEGPTDAEVLGAASGEDPDAVCPPARSYAVALAPPMAATRLGLAVPTLADLRDELGWPPDTAVGLVETAGGLRSPLAADGDNLRFVVACEPDAVVLVADAGLGTINAVRLCTDALASSGQHGVVVLNRFDDADALHRDNLRWLQERDGVDVVTATAAGLRSLAERLAAGAPATAR
ncbi:MAG: ATP-dependent dethiobiotin synthetase BioD [Acidimicrobiales bacterium]